MLLTDWLKENDVSLAEFGRQVGISRMQAWRYTKGAIPPKDVLIRIYLRTGGQVTPNDFYDLPAISSLGEALAGQNLTVGRSLSGQAPQSDDIGAEVAA